MFAILFRKLTTTKKLGISPSRQFVLLIGLALFMVFIVACSSSEVQVGATAVSPTTLPATDIPPTDDLETAVPTPHQPGSIITGEITSPALADNLLGDSNTKNYMVYLPPSYDTSDKRYPVVYFLHGSGQDETYHATPLAVALDDMIASGDAPEMIAIFPNIRTAFFGIGLYDSPTTGDYPTYLSHDLVNHIDENFRTIPHRDSRAIAGCGDATTSALNLAFTHPDIYSVPIAMTGIYKFEDHPLLWQSTLLVFKGTPADFAELDATIQNIWPVPLLMGIAAGAAPNPDNPPFYLDMPLEMVDGQAQIVPEVAAKINAMDPTHFLQAYLDQPLKFRGMLIYQKTRQARMRVETARGFDELLTQNGVEHEYIEDSSGHVAPFFCDYDLTVEFLAEHLSFEMVE